MSDTGLPINQLSTDGTLERWLVLGPFPNLPLPPPADDGPTRSGLDTDFLCGWGGEERAVLSPTMCTEFVDPDGSARSIHAKTVTLQPNGNIDFVSAFPGYPCDAAYASCLVRSETDQEVYAHFGSKDSAKVWVNGECVHRIWSERRAVNPWTDAFRLHLTEGRNRVLVKVEHGSEEWAFNLQLFTEAGYEEALQKHLRGFRVEVRPSVLPVGTRELSVLVKTEPGIQIPPLPIGISVQGGEQAGAAEVATCTGERTKLPLPGHAAGDFVVTARSLDDRFAHAKGQTSVFVGSFPSACDELLTELKSADLHAAFHKPWADQSEFAKRWLSAPPSEPTPSDIDMLRRISDLVHGGIAGQDFPTIHSGQLHAMRWTPPAELQPHWSGNYLAYLPKDYSETGKSWPLLVFLSTAGAAGTDINLLTRWDLTRRLRTDQTYPFVVVAPQCGPQRSWLALESEYLDRFLNHVLTTYHVDQDRVVLTGASMGGRAAWEWPVRSPGRFAATIPVCGRADPAVARLLGALPTWAWHGNCDGNVPIHYADLAVQACRDGGRPPRYTVIEGEGHDAWDHAYQSDELIEWMLAQRRQPTPASPEGVLMRGGLGPVTMVTIPQSPWWFLNLRASEEHAAAVIHQGQTRLYGALRTEAGLPARHPSVAVCEVVPGSDQSAWNIRLGLPLDEPLDAVPGIEAGSLAAFECAEAEYRGELAGLPTALHKLTETLLSAGHPPAQERRIVLVHLRPYSGFVHAILQIGVTA